MALMSYVAGSRTVVDGLLAKSGDTPSFVSRLAKDKIDDAKVQPSWVPWALGSMQPFFWHAVAPAFWTAVALLAFLESTGCAVGPGWQGLEVQSQQPAR